MVTGEEGGGRGNGMEHEPGKKKSMQVTNQNRSKLTYTQRILHKTKNR